MTNLIKIESITQLHELLGYEKPGHPLITILDYSKLTYDDRYKGVQVSTNFYSISLKKGASCRIKYGQKYYDFHEGSIICMAPDQTFTAEDYNEEKVQTGWGLYFHPDLIRKSSLSKKMKEYTFFSYDANEALHLSDKEKQTITTVIEKINEEINQNIDVYSQDLIISHIELLLNYCKRFYGRQFITRTNINKDTVSKFEEFLNEYFDSDKPKNDGLPSVKACAMEIGYSANYLSDLLKKETGKNTQEHIHFHLIEKAKNMLLGTNEPIYNIAYNLGFEYPQHFSKLFKKKTGVSPAAYRH